MGIYDKAKLAKDIALNGAIDEITALKVVDIITATIAKQLKLGDKICTDLGNFYTIHKAARVGTNPRTSALITIKAKNTVILRASKELKAALNA